jgi:hypothetical protein
LARMDPMTWTVSGKNAVIAENGDKVFMKIEHS